MNTAHRVALTLVSCLGASACQHVRPAPEAVVRPAVGDLMFEEVARLVRAHDYFALGERLQLASDSGSISALFARAVVEHATNHPAASNAVIARLLSVPSLGDSLTTVVATHWRIAASFFAVVTVHHTPC